MKFESRMMTGTLLQYGQGRQCFVSGPGGAGGGVVGAKVCVVLGGLSDGLLACPYAPALSEALGRLGWSTVQPVLRSSYCQFGFSSLAADCEDVAELLAFFGGDREVALVGHSTGSQIAASFVASGRAAHHVVFQAGVSDRETYDAAEAAARAPLLDLARDMVERRDGGEFLPRSAFWAPMTAQRYLDLLDVGGADDFFSADLGDDDLRSRFENFRGRNVNALVCYSGADEYAPPSVDKAGLVRRLCGAMKGPDNRVVGCVLDKANHNLSRDDDAAAVFVAAVAAFLSGAPIDPPPLYESPPANAP